MLKKLNNSTEDLFSDQLLGFALEYRVKIQKLANESKEQRINIFNCWI